MELGPHRRQHVRAVSRVDVADRGVTGLDRDVVPSRLEIELGRERCVGVLPPIVQQRCCPMTAGLRQRSQPGRRYWTGIIR